MDVRRRCCDLYPRGSFPARVIRRHVDLQRVSSALCPETSPVR